MNSAARYAAGLAMAGALATATMPEAVAFTPSKPIEFVVTAGAGGGTDIFARTIQTIIQKHNLVSQPIVVSIKGGGSGAEGFVHGKMGTGDAHRVVFGTSNQWLLPLVARVGWKREEHTPVAALAFPGAFPREVRPESLQRVERLSCYFASWRVTIGT